MEVTPSKASLAAQTQAQKTAEKRSKDAEKDADRRRIAAEQSARSAESEASERIDYIREESAKIASAEQERQGHNLLTQKNKGYENLRKMRHEQQQDMHRRHSDGERELAKTTDENERALLGAEADGRNQLRDTLNRHGQLEENEHKRMTGQFENSQMDHTMKMDNLSQRHQGQITELMDDYNLENERMESNSAEARTKADENFQRRYNETVSENAKSLDRLHQDAGGKLNQIRNDTAQKLSAYEARQSDPFYKMIDIDAKIKETESDFVLTAIIPEHERKHVQVSVRGDQLVLTGQRRNEEKLELGPGRIKGSSSFQTYQESFPLPVSVDAKKLTREFDGDRLIARIPKRSADFAERSPASKKASPERIRAEKPQFPENLPQPPTLHPSSGSRPLGRTRG